MSNIDEDTLNEQYQKFLSSYLPISIAILLGLGGLSQIIPSLLDKSNFSNLFLFEILCLLILISIGVISFYYHKKMVKNFKLVKHQYSEIIDSYKAQKTQSEEKIRKLEEKLNKSEDRNRKDNDTGLWNKEQIRGFVEERIGHSNNKNRPFSILFVDIDWFSRLNEIRYELGTSIIKQLADVLTQKSQGGDIVIRYGGDEFIIISDLGTDITGGLGYAKKIREYVENYNDFKDEKSPHPVKITVSCGVTTYSRNKHHDGDICKQLFNEASSAMTKAKAYREEKNYVMHFSQISSSSEQKLVSDHSIDTREIQK
jgi:diguanylate cyclase (GGDEF)-like protein